MMNLKTDHEKVVEYLKQLAEPSPAYMIAWRAGVPNLKIPRILGELANAGEIQAQWNHNQAQWEYFVPYANSRW